MKKPYHKRPLDDEFEKKLREVKRLAFRLLRESENVRIKYFINGLESDNDLIAAALDGVIRHTMKAAMESRKGLQQLWQDDA